MSIQVDGAATPALTRLAWVRRGFPSEVALRPDKAGCWFSEGCLDGRSRAVGLGRDGDSATGQSGLGRPKKPLCCERH